MAFLIKNLVNKHCSTRFITTLTPHLLANNQQSFFNQGFTINPRNNPQFFRPKEENGDNGVKPHPSDLHIYPSFSFGHFLNPIFPSGSELYQIIRPVLGEMEQSDPEVMWADSVKKKRKKKMNKHKYKKLRKRLRRKTKT